MSRKGKLIDIVTTVIFLACFTGYEGQVNSLPYDELLEALGERPSAIYPSNVRNIIPTFILTQLYALINLRVSDPPSAQKFPKTFAQISENQPIY